MQLETEILKEHSKRNTLRLAAWIGNNTSRFKVLMELLLKGEYRVTQRAAWIVAHCADRNPGLIEPYLRRMLERMLEPGVHVAVKRNVIRILEDIEIPKNLMGRIAGICFDLLTAQQEPIAVRVFSMSVLAKIARQEPDLKNELRLLIEQQMPWQGAAFRARGKRVLKELSLPDRKDGLKSRTTSIHPSSTPHFMISKSNHSVPE